MAVALPHPAEKAALVHAMFERIAPRYQRMNTILSFGLDRGWRRAAIAAAQLHAGDLVVDVACGTPPASIEPEGEDRVQALVARRDAVEHRANMGGLLGRKGER